MKHMRRGEARRDSGWALEVFDKAPFVTLSMVRPDATPYGIPLNMVRKVSLLFTFIVRQRVRKWIASYVIPL